MDVLLIVIHLRWIPKSNEALEEDQIGLIMEIKKQIDLATHVELMLNPLLAGSIIPQQRRVAVWLSLHHAGLQILHWPLCSDFTGPLMHLHHLLSKAGRI